MDNWRENEKNAEFPLNNMGNWQIIKNTGFPLNTMKNEKMQKLPFNNMENRQKNEKNVEFP